MGEIRMKNRENGPCRGSIMALGKWALVIIVGIGAAAYARMDLSQSGSDANVGASGKTIKCCPIVVPPEPRCRSPLKPPHWAGHKSHWTGRWNRWRKAKAEAKAKAEVKVRVHAKARAEAKAKERTKAKANTKARNETPTKIRGDAKTSNKAMGSKAKAMAKALAKARAEAMVWLWRK